MAKLRNFFAMLSRMKYINRWGLMRNTITENIAEHSLDVAVIAHGLAIIGNTYFGKQLNEDRIAVLAMYHDTTEIITGDMPTPIKYYNCDIKKVYKDIEKVAENRLIEKLPEDFKGEFENIYNPDKEIARLVKAADKLSAYIKCIEEENAGNSEFKKAKESILESKSSSSLAFSTYFAFASKRPQIP